MVKKLVDMCLQCIGQNLNNISQVGSLLPTKHKEILLQRIADHDMLTPDYLPHVTYHLFSPSLRSVRFKASEQVTDAVLMQLEACQCQLDSLVISKCNQVSGKVSQYLMLWKYHINKSSSNRIEWNLKHDIQIQQLIGLHIPRRKISSVKMSKSKIIENHWMNQNIPVQTSVSEWCHQMFGWWYIFHWTGIGCNGHLHHLRSVLMLHGGNEGHGSNEGDCLHGPWSLPWCPWNAPVEIYKFLIGCPLPRRKCALVPLPFQKRSIQASDNLTWD